MNIVECTNVYKSYQQGTVTVHALNGIDLSVEQGGFMALAGPSGSGKTTLLNLIGGLDLADTGHISLEGHALEEMNQAQLANLRLKRVGFVFQAYNLIPVLSALENVEFVMLLQGLNASERRERARAVLERMGLADRMANHPAQLSGGQQQRVAIARALVTNPALILADEPTGNVDTRTTQEILEVLDELHTHNITILLITHENDVAGRAQRTLVVRDGQIE